MNLGFIVILIVISGYASNWLNWRFLNYPITHALYYIGAFVHESSHALMCLVTGAKIREFSIFSSQPHVTHEKPRLPIIGSLLISSAPIFGGLCFLFLVDHYALAGRFTFGFAADWSALPINLLNLLGQINLLHWQSWVMILLLINAGAMLGPSFRDIQNMWPLLIVLCFVSSPLFTSVGMAALILILLDIVIQLISIGFLKAWNFFARGS